MLQVLPKRSVTLQVYDPAMCCSTGVCGPSVDQALLQFASDVQWLASRGIRVQRFNLAQQPDAFVHNHTVVGLMQEVEEQALPAIFINGALFVSGRYPSRDELLAALPPMQEQPSPL
jgi:hypothetical protein